MLLKASLNNRWFDVELLNEYYIQATKIISVSEVEEKTFDSNILMR